MVFKFVILTTFFLGKEGGLGNIQYPLLADKSMSVARSYGVLQEESGISFRGLFIIDGAQNLRQVTVCFQP
jgi:alkyl hydroperoxide reductase subunit AhpC